ncbi:glucans biosynthesis glucosyltransferase MdoH [Methylobacterium persicinum]|uniref:Glucans biosynthesis glucosyltransferase H n=1 Tax=Methylobacterium persicinum TaxID=374426 RepID=A0ABU0HS90_9HYPH|nr:glucans biosynthesis glucosyltransferase MdoH [Methylobacterium persicinum]MDQ0445176.1 membrane glycosyltransferase [Methylobacterium persicinum]GJE39088.1 Glucans biosynthesis glucosyltransferase H [Methylobacterium persicinum]
MQAPEVIEVAKGSPSLPPPAPMEMPVQSLRAPPPHEAGPVPASRGVAIRRVLVIAGAILMTAFGGRQMYLVLNGAGQSVLGWAVLILFVVLFAWISLAFTSALAGLADMILGRRNAVAADGLPALQARTALLMPCYNEHPARIAAGLQATYESLAATGRLDRFDFFILSDTTDPDIWIAEEASFLALRERTGGEARIFYRRRPKNIERKAGNIADWVTRFGAAYPLMLILDADSVMEGATIVRLAAMMEQEPGTGLIQTLPVIVNATTLFARLQQFAGRIYGPLIAHGIASWHGTEGNYWGHNAIIRTRAFATQAGLPVLAGPTPFGGHILSHDFVEAALIRRGGWAIRMVPELPGSFEEGPPSITEVAVRDRRWCQGNLQHAAVLPTRGLHWVSRLHLLMGIGSYITSPLWLIFLLFGVLISLQARFVRPEYFGDERLLFPNWPKVDPVLAQQLFGATMAVLLAPKLMAYIVLLFDPPMRRACGGGVRALCGVLIETLLGGLIAPIAMLIQSSAVVGILLGRDSGWNAQRRDDGAVSTRAVIAGYWQYTVFGLVLAGAAYAVSTPLFLWMTPVLAGLGLAVPLVLLTSSRSAGRALRRVGLLRTPEEAAPPQTLQRATTLYRQFVQEPDEDALRRLLRDPVLRRHHLDALPPPRRRGEGSIDPALVVGQAKVADADDLDRAWASLTRAEKAAVLGSYTGVTAILSLADRRA